MKSRRTLPASCLTSVSRLGVDSLCPALPIPPHARAPVDPLPSGKARTVVLLMASLASAPLFAQQGYQDNSPYAQPAYQPSYGQPQYPQPQYSQPQYPQPYAPQQQPYPNAAQPYPQQGYAQQPLGADQLQQLLAPIALYPDALLAQVLAASTYPAQVAAADQWLQWMQSQGYASPDQIVAGADAETGWDPSVKALTAFPQVLALMNRNLEWTTNLGNAYYNQPQDVMQTIQVMRGRAENAGTLQTTPQEDVDNSQGYIGIAPANPQVVYVPQYNPWGVYGQPVAPYSGFSPLSALGSFFGSSPIQYGLGIALSAFSRTPWGWLGWGLDWLTNSVLFQHNNYSTHSTSVADWGYHRGVPGAYPPARQGVARMNNGYGYGRPPENTYRNPSQLERYGVTRPAEGRGPTSPGSVYGRPALPPQTAYNRMPQPSRPQQFGSNAYGSNNRPWDNHITRPGMAYAAPSQPYRAPVSSYPREEMGSRPYGTQNYAPKENHSGGFHLFGGGHSSDKVYGGERMPKSYSFSGHEPKGFGREKAPKAPKMPKASHSGGGGHSGGGHHGFFGHSH